MFKQSIVDATYLTLAMLAGTVLHPILVPERIGSDHEKAVHLLTAQQLLHVPYVLAGGAPRTLLCIENDGESTADRFGTADEKNWDTISQL